jgi:DNA adenine methylase
MLVQQVVNVASVPHRSPFRYPGGKTWFVPFARRWLASLPSRPIELIEPFAGGAIVGLSALFERLVDRLLLVELDEDIAAVWRTILGGRSRELCNRILSFEMSLHSVQDVLSRPASDECDRAFLTIVRNRVQRGGILAPGASFMRKGEDGRGIGSRWYPTTLARRIEGIAALSSRIRFVAGDGIECIRANRDRTNAAFFIDPPYVVAGRRLYAHSDIDHSLLFASCSMIRGAFILTYDDAPAIRGLAQEACFDVRRIPMKTTHHEKKHEVVIGRDLSWLGL